MSSTVALAASVMIASMAAAVLVLVAAAASSRKPAVAPPAAAPPAAPAQKPKARKPSSTQPSRGGKQLGPDCKIVGDVYAGRAAKAGGIAQQNVRSTYHYYAPHYDVSTLACADDFKGYSSAKLMQYPWFAYCLGGRDTWNPGKLCGRCFRVTNRATGASIIGRAVDSGGCPGGTQSGIDADPCLFNAIDTNGDGVRDGHMMVDVQEVDC